MVELKDDLERVESDSNFQVRLLKSNFEDRLDSLENFPEYLLIMENRLRDSMQSKMELEKLVKKQDHTISKLKVTNAQFKDKNKAGERSKELLDMKVKDLEWLNEDLK
jgi:hypothetical protein